MFETLYLKVKNFVRTTKMRINRKRNREKDKLPKDMKYFDGGLYDAIYESSLKYPSNIAIEYFNTQVTYKELIRKINKVACALKHYGIEKGDKVTICMPNTPEAVYMFYAINEIGAVANMVHPLSSEKEIEDCLTASESRMMLCIDAVYPKVKKIIDNTKVEKLIVASATKSTERFTAFLYWLTKGRKIKIKEDAKVILWSHFTSKASLFRGNPRAKVNSNDLALILYSGGTTGKSKGVMLSNLNFNAQAIQCKYIVSDLLIPEHAFLTFLPNFHAFGIGISTHMPLFIGMRVVLIPKFDIKKLKKYIRKYKFNVICGVPTIYEYMSKLKFKKNELKNLKMVVSGGDAMNMQLKEKVDDMLAKYGSTSSLRVGYGLTEASGVVSFSPNGIKESDIIGYPFPDCDFLIKDLDSNKEVPVGEAGEILFRGATVMLGYMNNKEETENSFVTIHGKKWLRTGDIGFFDDQGLLHYKARLKRMIITNGYNVYPAHVEEIIRSSGVVEKCCVVGMPHASKGEMVKAFIVLKEGCNNISSKNKIKDVVKANLAKFEQPKEYAYIDDIPVTKMGKYDFRALQKM